MSGEIIGNGSGVAVARERGPKSGLRVLHETQVSLEKFRIATGNRLKALERGVDEADEPVPEEYARVFALADEMEGTIDDAIERELRSWPVYQNWARHVKGVGPSLAGQILAMLITPRPDIGPSAWYKAAGLAPESRPDGLTRLPKPRAGEGKVTYHPYLRRCLFNLGKSFVRNGGYYRRIYEERKRDGLRKHAWAAEETLTGWLSTSSAARVDWLVHRFGREHVAKAMAGQTAAQPGDEGDDEEAGTRTKVRAVRAADWAAFVDGALPPAVEHVLVEPTAGRAFNLSGPSDPAWPLHRIDAVARWRTVKLFLAHLWEAWAAEIGFEPRVPYPIEHLGHATRIPRPMPDGRVKI